MSTLSLPLQLNDYTNNVSKIKEYFGEDNCSFDGSAMYDCSPDNFECIVASDSYVTCKNKKTSKSCINSGYPSGFSCSN